MMRSVLPIDGATPWRSPKEPLLGILPSRRREGDESVHHNSGASSRVVVLTLLGDSIDHPHHAYPDLSCAIGTRFNEERTLVAGTHVG